MHSSGGAETETGSEARGVSHQEVGSCQLLAPTGGARQERDRPRAGLQRCATRLAGRGAHVCLRVRGPVCGRDYKFQGAQRRAWVFLAARPAGSQAGRLGLARATWSPSK